MREQVECVLRANGMGWAWDSGIADRLITCESTWNPLAISRTADYGLWQIHLSAHPWWPVYGDWRSPADNTAMAVRVYRDAGGSWRPWSCAR